MGVGNGSLADKNKSMERILNDYSVKRNIEKIIEKEETSRNNQFKNTKTDFVQKNYSTNNFQIKREMTGNLSKLKDSDFHNKSKSNIEDNGRNFSSSFITK